MTASRNKASRAVTAALVGVLSVGAVPMVAVAAESTGAVTLATDKADIAGATVSTTTSGQVLVPTSVELTGGSATVTKLTYAPSTTERKEDEWYYFYVQVDEVVDGNYDSVSYTDADGTVHTSVDGKVYTTGNGLPSEVGEYVLMVGQWNGTGWAGLVGNATYFQIEGQSLEGATLYQVNPADEDDVSDTTINFTLATDGRNVENVIDSIGVAVDGVALERYDEESGKGDYKIEIYEVGSSASSSSISEGTKLSCGTQYVAKITGKNDYAGETKQVTFTYEKFDLSTASVVTVDAIDNMNSLPAVGDVIESINGVTYEESRYNFSNYLKLTLVSDPGGNVISDYSANGEYTFKVSSANDDLVTGEATVTVVKADWAATFWYKGSQLESSYTVNLADEDEVAFDLSAIYATYDSGKTVPSRYVTVTATDADGNEVEDLTQAGTYTVTVSVDYSYNDDVTGQLKTVAGSAACTVKVAYDYGALTPENVFLTFDGKNVEDSTSVKYDGTDQLDKASVKVVTDDGATLTEGTDYTVTVTNEDGEEVDSVVDAGTYTVTVTGATYDGTASFTIVVEKLALDDAAITDAFATQTVTTTGSDGKTTENPRYVLVYTGSELDPTFALMDADDNVWELSDDEYEVTYTKDGKEADLLEEGYYTVAIKVSDDSTNFSGEFTMAGDVWVTSSKVFADVPSSGVWYSQYVYDAATMGYMSGYSDGTFFGPTDAISRADVVMVLWNMAGNPDMSKVEGATDGTGYDLPYSDVDTDGYYAQALYWATKVGIVSGDAGSHETFRPSDPVTREEFAKMLYVYEQLQGNVEGDVDEDEILSQFTDADSVSEWAEEYVAWLVDQGVMGVDTETINGGGNIVRAEVAAMAVRIQPDGQLSGFLGL